MVQAFAIRRVRLVLGNVSRGQRVRRTQPPEKAKPQRRDQRQSKAGSG
jgi:hypothetical protein